jgi:hypothetical protein
MFYNRDTVYVFRLEDTHKDENWKFFPLIIKLMKMVLKSLNNADHESELDFI